MMTVEQLLDMIVDLRFRMWEPDNPINDNAYIVFENCPEDGEGVAKSKKFKSNEKKKAFAFLEEQKTKFRTWLTEHFVINQRITINNIESVEALVTLLGTPNLQLPAKQ